MTLLKKDQKKPPGHAGISEDVENGMTRRKRRWKAPMQNAFHFLLARKDAMLKSPNDARLIDKFQKLESCHYVIRTLKDADGLTGSHNCPLVSCTAPI